MRYINPHAPKHRHTLRDFLRWQFGFYKEPVLDDDKSVQIPDLPLALDPKRPYATWINHSTYLIAIDGWRFLTDPIWSKRCSPVDFIGPKRRHPPGKGLHELPPVHIVLISHNHYDHLDKHTVLTLHKRFPQILWCVPSGLKNWFLKRGITHVQELAWWETHTQGEMRITSVPAQHFSGRSLRDTNRTHWCGYVVEIGEKKRFYFAGDTGYNPSDFKQIGRQFAPLDLSLIPIGSYKPRFFMQPVHLNPAEALLVHRDVGSRLSLAMHWHTFRLADEPMQRPPYDLYHAIKKAGIPPQQFLVLKPGDAINW